MLYRICTIKRTSVFFGAFFVDPYRSSGYLFYQFDQFWEQKKPENVMAFVPIKEEFRKLYEEQLAQTPPTIIMRL